MTLSGFNLAQAKVHVDGKAVATSSQNDRRIDLVMPRHANGIATIRLDAPTGTGYGEFLYVPPRLDEIGPGDITTVAGIGYFFGEGRQATQAMLNDAADFALAPDGTIYLAEPELNRILRIRPDGVIEHFAGTGGFGPGTGDGVPALETRLDQARGLAVDAAGNLIYTDSLSNRVRRIEASTGLVTTIAGTGAAGYSGDGGPAINARLDTPTNPTIDMAGNIYFIDFENFRVRRIDAQGIITTIAGDGKRGSSGDGGPATEAEFDTIFLDAGDLEVGPAGDLYLADSGNNEIRRIDVRTGTISHVADVFEAWSVAFDRSGDLYFASDLDPRITRMRGGRIVDVYGQGHGFVEDGAVATNAELGYIDKLRVDAQGNILYTDHSARRLRRINVATGLLETVAGIGPAVIGEGGPATGTAMHLRATDLAFLSGGDLLIADAFADRVWRLDQTGRAESYIGNGFTPDFDSYGLSLGHILIAYPIAVEVDAAGTVFVLDNQKLSELDVDGVYRHVAGAHLDGGGFSGDGGPAVDAVFEQPWDFALDSDGNIFIADTNNNRIRRIDAVTHVVTTIAGSGDPNGYEGYGQGSFCGDGGPALEACLNTPYGVAVRPDGLIYIVDSENARIRRISNSGVITTFADLRPYGGRPSKMVFDGAGNLFLGCGTRILRITPTGSIDVLAGSDRGFSGDGGPATDAQVALHGLADGIAIDAAGNLWFADAQHGRLRVIKGVTDTPPSF